MRILKTDIPVDDHWHDVEIGDIVHVGHQKWGHITIWWWDHVSGQKLSALPTRRFRAYGTGWEVPQFEPILDGSASPVHRGTAVDIGNKAVWHLIEDVLS